MNLKNLIWNTGDEDNPQSEVPIEETTTPAQTQPVRRSTPLQTVNPLSALRTGPTASIFTRTTGLPMTPSLLPSSTTHVAVDREFDDVITGALEQDAKALGFKEFTAQLNALSSIIPDKGQCVKAALAAVTAINPSLNATVVARAIGERLKLLSDYQASYEADSRRSESAETSDKRTAMEEVQSRMQEIDAEIQRLAGERAQCEQQRAKLDSEMQGVGSKYDGYRVRFSGTVEARRNELKSLLGAVAPGTKEEN